jgi:hypothetical protein
MKPSEQAWNRLAPIAARAPEESADLPLGFATRTVANWKAYPGERVASMVEFFTWRGLALAMVILIGTVAIGYDAVSGFVAGDTSVTDNMVQFIPDWAQ